MYLVLEYAPGGLLFEITEDLGSVGEDQARVMFREMLDAVNFMHKQGVWHRDLKLENVLVDENLNIKLADLGFASCQQGLLDSYKGTQIYMAPEIAQKLEYSGDKADIFSLGVTLFTLTVGMFPFSQSTPEDPYYKFLVAKDYLGYWQLLEVHDHSKEFKDLFQRLTMYSPDERISMEEILAHPWVTKETPLSALEHKKQIAEKLNEIRIDKNRRKQEEQMKSAVNAQPYTRSAEDEPINVSDQFEKIYKFQDFAVWSTKKTTNQFWEALEEQAI